MRSELISVIVPVYKAEKYLDECVDSIVNQTYQDLEIILVDDGSPDRCPEMCDEWARKDPRIIVIHKENGGASSARNAGLGIANGTYIGFVDSDDCIKSDMYERLWSALRNSDKKVACCRIAGSRHLLQAPNHPDYPRVKQYNVKDTVEGILRGWAGTSFCRRLCHRSVFERIRFPEGEVNEEYPIIFPATVLGGGMVHVWEFLYYYRPSPSGVTGTFWKKSGEILLRNLDQMYFQLKEYGLDCMPAFRSFKIRAVYSVAVSYEKNRSQLDRAARETYRRYLRIMRKELLFVMKGRFMKPKDKLIYLMIVTRILGPVYIILGHI